MNRKQKKLEKLRQKLSDFESRLLRRMPPFDEVITESVSSKADYEESFILSVTIDDLRREIEDLENNI